MNGYHKKYICVWYAIKHTPLCHKRKNYYYFLGDNMQQKQQSTPDDSVKQVTFWQAFYFGSSLALLVLVGQLDKSL
mgnify:CR=1 FL=1